MKKLVLFLMVVLMGVFPTVNSYAARDFSKECKPRKELKIGASGNDNLYLDETDFDLTFNQPNYSLKCDTALGDDEHCWDNTLVFVTKKTFIGDALVAANKSIIPFTEGPTLIKCKVGINDKWEKVGGIDKLPKCGNSAPEKTITVGGKTIHCARKEKRGNQEYCIGIESGDICVDSGNGKSAEKPKEAEQKKEAKPIEENNEPKENCDTSQGYEYNPVSKKCVRTEAGKPEEKKEEPKKEEPKKAAPAKRKEAPKAKQKSGKAIFMDDCAEARGALDQNETTCTLTDETITDIDALNKAIETYNQKFGKAEGKCQSLTYKGAKMWSTACKAEDEFVGTWLIYMPNITCENGTFNDETGKCDTTNAAAEEPAKAENAPAANGSEEASAEEAAPAATTGEDNSNDEWAALHNDAKRIVDAYNDQKTKLENKQK